MEREKEGRGEVEGGGEWCGKEQEGEGKNDEGIRR